MLHFYSGRRKEEVKMKEIIDLRIMNTENHTYYAFYVREDRFTEFIRFLKDHHESLPRKNWEQGVDGSAVLGFSTIFTSMPTMQKFPVLDVLKFLRDYTLNPLISLEEVERGLTHFALTRNTLRGDGTEVE
jgi:hypothetical protein